MPDHPALTPDQAAALVSFARAHGPRWKSALRTLWMTASAQPALHRLRNTHGPAWLARYVLEAPAPVDFTLFADPALAVPCPVCRRRAGAWCARPSGHCAMKLHASRAVAADLAFAEQHGDAATIELSAAGRWVIDPQGRARD